MAMNKRKTTTTIVAGVTALALLLGGTFAWTSISQQAKNEAVVDINPGGRLHDDFNGTNKDVYVENFGDKLTGVDIFARIRLYEYMEIGQQAGDKTTTDGKKANSLINGDTINDTANWEIYKYGQESAFTKYWDWTLGNNDENALPYYMPTFNMNKDSLAADINGTYEGTIEGDIVHYDDYVEYGADSVKEGTEVYDWDEDTTEEDGNTIAWDNGGITEDDTTPIDSADVYHKSTVIGEDGTESALTHTAEQINTTSIIMSMEEWIAAGSQPGNYWVFDTDGWAYWANPIQPGETTGLLLDSISMIRVPDDNWYYGINIVGQFATANDWTMLYAPVDDGGAGEGEMTDNAKTLMTLITGIAATEDEGNDGDITENGTLTLRQDNADTETVTVNTSLPVEFDATDLDTTVEGYVAPDMSEIILTYTTADETGTTVTLENTQYTYTYDTDTETGTLTITDSTLAGESLHVTDKNEVVEGDVEVVSEDGGDTPGSGSGDVPLIEVNGADAGYEMFFGTGAEFTVSTADTIEGVDVEGAIVDSYSWPENVTPVQNDDGTITVTVGEVTEAAYIAIFASGTLNGESISDSLQINLTPDLSSNGINIYLPSGYSGGMSPGFGGKFTASSSDVTWSITGNNDTDTSVEPSTGAISIGNNETAETIILRAESTTDSSLYGIFNLKIITDGMLSITATEVDGTITLVPRDVREDTQTDPAFTDTYTWTVSPETGLTVADDGTLAATVAGTYTVTATSNSNSRVTATIGVTVNDDLSITVA